MDNLGRRIIADQGHILIKRGRAYELEKEVKRLRNEADEIERLLELARLQR